MSEIDLNNIRKLLALVIGAGLTFAVTHWGIDLTASLDAVVDIAIYTITAAALYFAANTAEGLGYAKKALVAAVGVGLVWANGYFGIGMALSGAESVQAASGGLVEGVMSLATVIGVYGFANSRKAS